ncbi:radical SAM protein [Betaproteobacteria bacterium]|nr:radical SAM protein [Betaproteobacteria bacterium]
MIKDKIVSAIGDSNVAIWGARMTGMGAVRFLRSKGVEPRLFIDSDKSLSGKLISNLNVYNPLSLRKMVMNGDVETILIAVALKEKEIKEEIERTLGKKNQIKVFSFQDEEVPYYTVDILGSCNLKCSSCPHSIEDNNTPRGSMRYETFRKVFDKILRETPELSHISLYSWGEPLIHPKVVDFVNLIHSKNIAVALSSNLSLNMPERLEDLVMSRPDVLKVSVSGFNQEVYGSTHEGGDIRLVKSNLYLLRYLMDKHKSSFLVDINYHLYRNNIGKDLQEFKSLANELGFVLSETYSLVMPLERVFNYLDGNSDKQTERLNKELLLVNIDEGIEASGGKGLPSRSCPYRENQINVNSDLSVPLCCLTFDRNKNSMVSNNYLEISFDEINKKKKKKEICLKCQSFGLQEYSMNSNRMEWELVANRKITENADFLTADGKVIAD